MINILIRFGILTCLEVRMRRLLAARFVLLLVCSNRAKSRICVDPVDFFVVWQLPKLNLSLSFVCLRNLPQPSPHEETYYNQFSSNLFSSFLPQVSGLYGSYFFTVYSFYSQNIGFKKKKFAEYYCWCFFFFDNLYCWSNLNWVNVGWILSRSRVAEKKRFDCFLLLVAFYISCTPVGGVYSNLAHAMPILSVFVFSAIP